jgi:hypothetical protein
MTKYKNVEEKIDEALKLSKETGKEQGFNICQSGEEITTTNIQEVDRDLSDENKCPETNLGSLHVYPESKDAAPFPKDISNIQTDVQKV